jgi:hypothetical protein
LETTDPATEAETSPVILPYYDHSARYVLGPADLDQTIVSTNPRPSVVQSDQEKGYEVEVNFSPPGAFDAIAAKRYAYYQQNSQNPLYQSMEAIEVNGVVMSAPVIQAPSFNGVAIISGSTEAPFTLKQATDLAETILFARKAHR